MATQSGASSGSALLGPILIALRLACGGGAGDAYHSGRVCAQNLPRLGHDRGRRHGRRVRGGDDSL